MDALKKAYVFLFILTAALFLLPVASARESATPTLSATALDACTDNPTLEVTNVSGGGYSYTLQKKNANTWITVQGAQGGYQFPNITLSGTYRALVQKAGEADQYTNEFSFRASNKPINITDYNIMPANCNDFPSVEFACSFPDNSDPENTITITIEKQRIINNTITWSLWNNKQISGRNIAKTKWDINDRTGGTFRFTIKVGSCAKKTEIIYLEPRPELYKVTSSHPDPLDLTKGKACSGDAVNFSVNANISGNAFLWQVCDNSTGICEAKQGPFTGTNQHAFTFNPTTLTNYTVKVFLRTGSCDYEIGSYEININPIPSPTLTPRIGCVGNDIKFNTDPGKTNYQWEWSNTNITRKAGGNGTQGRVGLDDYVTLNFSQGGTYRIGLKYIDVTGCYLADYKYYEINISQPDIYDQSNEKVNGKFNVCNGTTHTYRASDKLDRVIPISKSNYQWAVQGGVITAGGGAGDNYMTVRWNSALSLTRQVSLNYQNDTFGCQAATPTIIPVVIHEPIITCDNPITCPNTESEFTASGSTGNYQWKIYRTDKVTEASADECTILGRTDQTKFKVQWLKGGTYYVGLTATTSLGCTTTLPTFYEVSVFTPPTPNVSGQTNPCYGQSVTYTMTDAQAGIRDYLWELSDSRAGHITSAKNQKSVTVLWDSSLDPATEDIYLHATYTGTNNCPGTNKIPIKLFRPVFQSGEALVCNNAASEYTAPTTSNEYGYTWSIIPSTAGDIISGIGTSSIKINWKNSGKLTLNYNRGGANDCISTEPVTLDVTVRTPPTASIIPGINTLCLGSNSDYESATVATGYRWSLEPAEAGIITPASADSKKITVTWTMASTSAAKHKVFLQVQDTDGCWSDVNTRASQEVEVKGPIIEDASSKKNTCKGNTEIYSAPSNMNNYLWAVSPLAPSTAAGYRVVSVANNTNQYEIEWLQAGSYNVTISYSDPSVVDCNSLTTTLKVTVHPLPNVTNDNTVPATICSGSTWSLNFTSDQPGAIYSWNAAVVGTGSIAAIPMSGTGNISQAIVNTGTTNVQVKYTVTATTLGCPGPAKDFLVTIYPLAGITNPNVQATLCSGSPFAVNFTPSVSDATTTYAWSASASPATVTGITANGSGNINETNLQNTGDAPSVVTYTVIPSANGCAGVAKSFTVKVLPVARVANTTVNYQICTSQAESKIELASSVSDYPTHFDWSVTAPAGISGAVAGTDKSTIDLSTLQNSGNTPLTVTYKVTPYLLLADNLTHCNGTEKEFTVVVGPVPTINTPAVYTSEICSTDAVNIPLSSNVANDVTFQWTVRASAGSDLEGFSPDNTGTMTTISQTVKNNKNTPATLTYTVTPYYKDCPGTPKDFVVTVKPRPVPEIFDPQLAPCINQEITYSVAAGMTDYTWGIAGGVVNTDYIIKQGILGTSSNSSIKIQWLTSKEFTLSVNFTAAATGCPATAATEYTVKVQSLPKITNPDADKDKTICSNTSPDTGLSSDIEGTIFRWTATGTAGVSGYSDANGPSLAQVLTNTTDVEQTVTYTVTPISPFGCEGTPVIFKVKVLPVANVSNVTTSYTICSGGEITINLLSNVGGATFKWTAEASEGIQEVITAGTGGQIRQILTNTGDTPATVTYKVIALTPTNNCEGPAKTFTVNVRPVLYNNITDPRNHIACLNETVTYTSVAGMNDYLWSFDTGAAIKTAGGDGTNSITLTWVQTGTHSIGIVYKDNSGCEVSEANSKYAVEVMPLPVPTITGDNNGRTFVGLTVRYQTEVGMTAYQWDYLRSKATLIAGGTSTDNFIDLQWNETGDYNVKVNYTNGNNCTGIAATNFDVFVIESSLSGLTNVCKGSQTIYSTEAGMSNYRWTYPTDYARIVTGGTSRDNFMELEWLRPNQGVDCIVSVVYKLPVGDASSFAQLRVNIHNPTRPQLTGPTQISCIGDTYQYDTQAGMTDYLWTIPAGLADVMGGGGRNDSFVKLKWKAGYAGPSQLSVNFKNQGGCSDATPTALGIEINPITSVTFNNIQNPLCFGETNGHFVVNVTGGFAPFTYSVNGAQAQSSNHIEGLPAGKHTITVTDNIGCSIQNYITLTQPAPISIDEAVQTKIVTNAGKSDGQIRVLASGGTAPLLYTLRGTDRPAQANGTFSNLREGVYTVDVTDLNGCVITAQVTVRDPFVAKISNLMVAQPTCLGDKGAASYTIDLSEREPIEYKLYYNSALIDDQTIDMNLPVNLPNLEAGQYTIILTYFIAGEPSIEKDRVSFTIEQLYPDQISYTYKNITCGGELANDGIIRAVIKDHTGNTPANIAGYQYRLDDLSGVYRDWQGSPEFTYLEPGTYYINVKNDRGCTTLLNTQIKIFEPLMPLNISIFQTKNPSCHNMADGEITLLAKGGWGGYQYSLDGVNFNPTATFSGLKAGSYLLWVKDSNDCIKSVSATLNNPPEIVIQDGGIARLLSCSGYSDAEIYVQATGGIAPLTYELVQKSITNTTGYFIGLSAGHYDILIKDAAGCHISYPLTVNDPQGMVLSPRMDYDCYQNMTLYVEAVGGTTPYTYDFGNGFSVKNYQEHIEPGHYTMTVRVKDAHDCIETIDYLIDIEPLAIQGEVMNITNLVINGTGGIKPYSYSFDGERYTQDNVQLSNKDGIYTIWIQDAIGCKVSQEVEVKSIQLEADNFFTPNGDGINDTWNFELYAADNLTEAKEAGIDNFKKSFPNAIIRIYDRTGRTIKELRGWEEGWDGTFNGKHLASDTYWYEIRLTPTSNVSKIGNITITR